MTCIGRGWEKRKEKAVTKFSMFIGAWVALLGVGAIVMVSASMPSAAERAAQIKLQAQEVPYWLLSGVPEQYQTKPVVLRGTVVQAMDNMLRVDVGFSIGDIVWVEYQPRANNMPRLQQGDRIKFWGTYVGISYYETVFGQRIEVPHVVAEIVEPLRPARQTCPPGTVACPAS